MLLVFIKAKGLTDTFGNALITVRAFPTAILTGRGAFILLSLLRKVKRYQSLRTSIRLRAISMPAGVGAGAAGVAERPCAHRNERPFRREMGTQRIQGARRQSPCRAAICERRRRQGGPVSKRRVVDMG